MTVKWEHLTVGKQSVDQYYEGRDLLVGLSLGEAPEQVAREIALSVVRVTLQTHDCDQIPVITELRVKPYPDQWGSNLYATLQYAKRGWRASWGGHWNPVSRKFEWQLYMD